MRRCSFVASWIAAAEAIWLAGIYTIRFLRWLDHKEALDDLMADDGQFDDDEGRTTR